MAHAATIAHRAAQGRLMARTADDILATWRLLDPQRLDATAADWIRVALAVVGRRNTESARLAAAYVSTMRRAKGLTSAFSAALAAPPADAAVATSLLVTGPYRLKSALTAGQPYTTALAHAQAGTARSAGRHVLAGGRSTILDAVRSDPAAKGWVRVTGPEPCAFCALLAGIHHAAESSVGYEAHDGCQCTAEPIY